MKILMYDLHSAAESQVILLRKMIIKSDIKIAIQSQRNKRELDPNKAFATFNHLRTRDAHVPP